MPYHNKLDVFFNLYETQFEFYLNNHNILEIKGDGDAHFFEKF